MDADGRREYFVEELKAFQLDLVDPEVRAEVNRSLGNAGESTFKYYDDRPELSRQTRDMDLHRMTYVAYPPDSGNHDDVGDEGQGAGVGVGVEGRGVTDIESLQTLFDETHDDPMWRMANQSIFAELMLSLQRKMLRPDLSMAIRNTTSDFEVDLGKRLLRARSTFRICTVTADMAEPLILGDWGGEVSVNLSKRTIHQQFGTPRLNVVFDQQWQAVAMALVEHERAFGPMAAPSPDSSAALTLDAVRGSLTTLGSGVANLRGAVTQSIGTSVTQISGTVASTAMNLGGTVTNTVTNVGGSVTGKLGAVLGNMSLGADEPLRLYRPDDDVPADGRVDASEAANGADEVQGARGGSGGGMKLYRTPGEVESEAGPQEEIGRDVVAEAASAVWGGFTSMFTPRNQKEEERPTFYRK